MAQGRVPSPTLTYDYIWTYLLIVRTHSKNIDKCGKNPQSARRKLNYHTKCGKNCHKILSVWYFETWRSTNLERMLH